jgi:hypothetical protein
MHSGDKDYRALLSELGTLRKQFEIRADFLPGDLALTGLLDDLLDASAAAIEFADRSPRVVYPLVRTAFEAAQRIVALATDDDYLRTGTRAWLYYQRKDASVRRTTDAEKADQWLEAVVSRMRDIWSAHNKAAAQLLTTESASLDESAKKRRPDNFMCKDLAAVVQDCYARMYGPTAIPNEVKQLNRGIYAALSRDSHARLRLEPEALTFLSNGTVRVIPRLVDESLRRRNLLECLESSLAETIAAVFYLLETRRQTYAEALRSAAQAISNDLPPGFSPDLGLHLAQCGGGGTVFHFRNVPLHKLGVQSDGTLLWSANIVLDDGEYIATFEVPVVLHGDLAGAIGISADRLAPSTEGVTHKLAVPCSLGLECTLGEIRRTGSDAFVPLVVKHVTPTQARDGA